MKGERERERGSSSLPVAETAEGLDPTAEGHVDGPTPAASKDLFGVSCEAQPRSTGNNMHAFEWNPNVERSCGEAW